MSERMDADDMTGPARPLTGRIAVVTGGGRGIGRIISVALGAAGARVVVAYARSEADTQETVAAIESTGGQAQAVRADVTSAADVERLAGIAAGLGGPHLWINNAGASANSSESAGLSDEERWDRVMRVDVKGTWLCCRAAAPRIRAAGGGAIINVGWNHAYDGYAGLVGGIYAASKAGVLALTRSLAREWAPDVRVNAVAPGWIENEWSAGRTPAFRERVANGIPLHRWGRPEDIAAAVLYLCSPGAAFITGQTMVVDGGEVMG
ncbi:MAG TPA: SDR family oxidoreductase [Ktedonobacterales bacterium]|nr:SDR family oxidoreductase [Ktedonobacterales bacterium]